jgi:hypothetical protein
VQSSPSVARPFKVLAHATVTPMSDPDRIVKWLNWVHPLTENSLFSLAAEITEMESDLA